MLGVNPISDGPVRVPHVSRWTPSPLGQEHQGGPIVRKELSGCKLVRAPHVSR